jgi:thiosulfate/3-mercaptopyruvate sulfurtransferase
MVYFGRLIFGAILFCGCAGSDKPVPPAPSLDERTENSFDLVQPEQIQAELESTTIIDIRKRADYMKGHLPGAQQLWRDHLQSDEYPFGGMCVDKARLTFLLDSIGCSTGQKIVVYDAKGGCDAARLWWMLKYYGHHQVKLLDGGLQLWEQSGLPLDTGLTAIPEKKGFEFMEHGDHSLIVSYEQVQEAVNDTNVIIVDTRTIEEYNGSVLKEGAFYAGHIPGSVNFDWGRCVQMDSDWKLKSNDAIVADMVAAGIDTSKRIITYCHTGVRSAHTTFVLRELMGFSDVSNYDGSWSEWSFRTLEK